MFWKRCPGIRDMHWLLLAGLCTLGCIDGQVGIWLVLWPVLFMTGTSCEPNCMHFILCTFANRNLPFHLRTVSQGLCSLACGRRCSCLHNHESSHFLPDLMCGGCLECKPLRRRLTREAFLRISNLKSKDLVMFCDSNQVLKS